MNKSLYRATETTIAAIADFYRQAKQGAASLNRASFTGVVGRKSIPSRVSNPTIIRVDFIVNATLNDLSTREFGSLSIDITPDTTISDMFRLMQQEFNTILASHYQIRDMTFSTRMAYAL